MKGRPRERAQIIIKKLPWKKFNFTIFNNSKYFLKNGKLLRMFNNLSGTLEFLPFSRLREKHEISFHENIFLLNFSLQINVLLHSIPSLFSPVKVFLFLDKVYFTGIKHLINIVKIIFYIQVLSSFIYFFLPLIRNFLNRQ